VGVAGPKLTTTLCAISPFDTLHRHDHVLLRLRHACPIRKVFRGDLLTRRVHVGARWEVGSISTGHSPTAEKGGPQDGDVRHRASILPEEPPLVLDFENAQKTSFGNSVGGDLVERPHVTGPDFGSAVIGENTVYPSTDGV